MKKNKRVAIALKVITVIIILIGLYSIKYLRLWETEIYHDEFMILCPIIVLGFSGTLYGLATLIEK